MIEYILLKKSNSFPSEMYHLPVLRAPRLCPHYLTHEDVLGQVMGTRGLKLSNLQTCSFHKYSLSAHMSQALFYEPGVCLCIQQAQVLSSESFLSTGETGNDIKISNFCHPSANGK